MVLRVFAGREFRHALGMGERIFLIAAMIFGIVVPMGFVLATALSILEVRWPP